MSRPRGAAATPGWLRSAGNRIAQLAGTELLGTKPPADGSGRPCAILIVFSPRPDASPAGPAASRILLTERAHTLRSHAGQVSFPGGAIDPGDGGPVGAALREAAEETGLDPGGVDVVGMLPQVYVPHSANLVTPVLAWAGAPSPVGVVDPREVASVHWVGVRTLLDPANRLQVRNLVGRTGPAFTVPAPGCGSDLVVWGFTGGLLDRLFALAGWERPWDHTWVEDLDLSHGPAERAVDDTPGVA